MKVATTQVYRLIARTDAPLKIQALWTEGMAIAMHLRFRQLDQAMLTITDFRNYPIYRWQIEVCTLLDEGLAALTPVG